MPSLAPYLTFNGNCREAVTFYARAFGAAEPLIQTFGESPVDAPDDAKGHVMHAHVDAGAVQIMASDSMPGEPATAGSNVSLSLHCDSEAEQTRLFNTLSDGGNVTMPLENTFWGARFGMCTDKFGVHWMLNYPLEQS